MKKCKIPQEGEAALSEHNLPISARVLVIDDLLQSRMKLTKALDAISVPNTAAEDGRQGLQRLHDGNFDLVLLDILMPHIDGFEVLREMAKHKRLREIPVLVVSSLDRGDDIARALELGAVDFLPKVFDPAIFKARVFGTLEKKRLRDIELDYIEDVERLTKAAERVSQGQKAPGSLGLSKVTQRDDALGNLAQVFSDFTESVYRREKAATLRINLLQGCLLLLIMGLSWGVVPALSKLMIGPQTLPPLGVAAWVSAVTLAIVSLMMIVLGKRPRFSAATMRFGLIAGLFAGVLPQTALFWASSHISGVVLSITLALESLLVFSIAAALRIESPSLNRFFGLFLGLVAVLVVVFAGGTNASFANPLWMLVAIVVPLSYAIESILVAAQPEDKSTSPIEFLFFIMLGSSIWGWSGAVATGSVLIPATLETTTIILIATIGLMSAISNGSYVLTIRKMGAVFASQYAYVVTILGVGWSVLLLNERLTLWHWVALGLILTGIFIVRPKEKTETFVDAVTTDFKPGSRA